MEAQTAKASQLEDMLNLAVNSLQRLHAGHGENAESDDEAMDTNAGCLDGEDDDDDPFFMPMPGAIKWAEASKFKELAKPLTPELPADKQFMIVMGDGTTKLSVVQQYCKRGGVCRRVEVKLRWGNASL